MEFREISRSAPGTPEANVHRVGKKELLDQHGVNHAVLAGAAHYTGPPNFSLNDRTLREEVPADEVDICRVLFHVLDRDFLCFTRRRVRDGRKVGTECSNLCLAATNPDVVVSLLADVGLSRSPAALIPPFPDCRVVPPTGEAPDGSTLPLYNITSGYLL
jgi:hypothetical protein